MNEIESDRCSNCGEPLSDETPDRHEHGLRRCVGLRSQLGDVYASRGYPRTESATERARADIIARANPQGPADGRQVEEGSA